MNLAISRQKAENCQAIFWLDETRAHDGELLKYVRPLLEAKGVADTFQIMAPREATRASLETITKGENTIAITGNVLRDYLTDLFPILELATPAKMLSIVNLMQGGGLFETGAGGSAPKHVQQLHGENHLRWDSMGEFCALGESLNFLADVKGNAKAGVLGLTKSLADAFGADNIRVNAIEPGAIFTERQRELWYPTEADVDALVSRQLLKRAMDGGEIGRMALFLASDDARMITKQSFIVDGGLL